MRWWRDLACLEGGKEIERNLNEAITNTVSTGQPSHLPRGWTRATIGRVAAINPATDIDNLSPDEPVAFVPMASVAEETGEIDFSARRPLREAAKGYVRFQEGDVIFAKITPCMENGKIAPVVGAPTSIVAGSTEFHVLRPIAVEQRYLWHLLVARAFRGLAQRTMSGSAGQLRVPVGFLRETELALAPLAEQRRIVERIDSLFAEIAEGEAALAEARKGLDLFRRSLLKAAVTGELTRDWRESNKRVETGSQLLARLASTRRMLSTERRRGRRLTARPSGCSASTRAGPPDYSRRTCSAGLSSRRPTKTVCRSNPSAVHVKYVISTTSFGSTQCTRERTSGEPKRVLRGGGRSEARWRGLAAADRRTLMGIPVPTRPA
jgi:Type I restriction modification DNA specificity domain